MDERSAFQLRSVCYHQTVFQYTYRNHFKFGYNQTHEFQFRNLSSDQFSFEYGRTSQTHLSWRQSNELAARQIYQNQNITVLLSGGMDSEICFKSFFDQNLPVKTVSLRFLDLDQSEELSYIQKAIDKYNIKDHQFVDIKVKKFVESKEFFEIAGFTKCVSPIVILHLWLANQIDGTPVIAQGEVHLKKTIPENYIPGLSPYEPSEWYITESERLCSIYMNFILRKKPAVPGFFQYNPEQIYSYLTQNKLLSDLVNNQVVGKLGTRTSKNIIAQQFYPDIELRAKRHGWESIQSFHDELRQKLALRFPDSDSESKMLLKDLMKMIS
jgi:hypothetical protein